MKRASLTALPRADRGAVCSGRSAAVTDHQAPVLSSEEMSGQRADEAARLWGEWRGAGRALDRHVRVVFGRIH